jgi:hypothetical protein
MQRFTPLLLFWFFFALPHCQAAGPAPDLKIELSIREEENSDDSNSQTTKITIDGRHVVFEWVYSGYHPHSGDVPPVKKTASLTDEQVTALLKLIADKHLDVARDEKSTGTPSMGRTIAATFSLTRGDKTVKTMLSGWMDVWGKDEKTTQVVPKESVNALRAFASFIEINVMKGKK